MGDWLPSSRLELMGRRVLVCDDASYIRKLFTKVLCSDGHTLEEWDRGDGLVEKALEFSPDLILLDLIMPGPRAPETIKALLSQPSLEKVPILLLSGCEGDPLVDEALEAGASCFLAKPIEISRLSSVVREFSGSSSADR